jgi:hypothetical protein
VRRISATPAKRTTIEDGLAAGAGAGSLAPAPDPTGPAVLGEPPIPLGGPQLADDRVVHPGGPSPPACRPPPLLPPVTTHSRLLTRRGPAAPLPQGPLPTCSWTPWWSQDWACSAHLSPALDFASIVPPTAQELLRVQPVAARVLFCAPRGQAMARVSTPTDEAERAKARKANPPQANPPRRGGGPQMTQMTHQQP